MNNIATQLIQDCKQKLLQKKSELLNRLQEVKTSNLQREFGGDEADQSLAILAENDFLNAQERLRVLFLEVESALARIQNGTFGICEETEEFIEPKRLLAIPWTRLSIEGAEMKESMSKKYASINTIK